MPHEISAVGPAQGGAPQHADGARSQPERERRLSDREHAGHGCLLEHRALPYGSDEEFLAGAAPLAAEGIDQDHAVLVVTARPNIAHLRDALAERGDHIDFADSADWYSSPRAALDRYRTFMNEKLDAGSAWMRIVGEPVWAGRSDAEITEWIRYESMINLVFASAPVTLVCPYDARSVPADVLAGAHCTHPDIAHGTDSSTSSTYLEPEDLLLEP